jgi:hypothetical protein
MEHHRDELEPDAGTQAAEATTMAAGPSDVAAAGLSAATRSGAMSPGQVMALQGSAGNAAVLRLLSETGHAEIRDEPPASTPTSAESPLDVDPPFIEDDYGSLIGAEEGEVGAPAGSSAAESGPLAVPESPAQDAPGPGHQEAEHSGDQPAPGPAVADAPTPALPPAGASRDTVITALRGANGAKKTDAAWVTYVNGVFAAGSDDARLAKNLLLFGPEASWPAPTAGSLIPFDAAPLSAPGERIIFNLEYAPASGVEYHEIVVTASDGKFAAGGVATKTIKGLTTGNLDFLIPASWTGTSAITVKAEVRPRGNAAVLTSKTWTFNKKARFPTSMTQKEGEGEVAIGSTYEYTIGPAVAGKTAPYYEHQTILERFPSRTCNITPADLTDAFKAANPGLTDSEKINAHFFGGSSSNGTFTVSNADKIWDGHTGILSTKADIEPHLKAWKEIHNDVFQVYEAEPGKVLGKYTIRRIIKADGSLALRKFKTP